MKKKYVTPSMIVVKLKHRPSLLEGSPMKTTETQRYQLGTESYTGDGD